MFHRIEASGVGNLTRDSEIKYTTGGTAVVEFDIAVNHFSKDRERGEVSYFKCKWFGKAAEGCKKFLVKGTLVMVFGELRQERWSDSNGVAKSSVKINVSNLILMPSKGSQPISEQREEQKDFGLGAEQPTEFDDDIPF